jgi:hypothetical protein
MCRLSSIYILILQDIWVERRKDRCLVELQLEGPYYPPHTASSRSGSSVLADKLHRSLIFSSSVICTFDEFLSLEPQVLINHFNHRG